jgi:hypothetical protein
VKNRIERERTERDHPNLMPARLGALGIRPGKPAAEYVRRAGGATTRGEVDRSWVAQPNGRIETKRSRRFRGDALPIPLPGAIITVPERDPSDDGRFKITRADLVQFGSLVLTLITLTNQR